MAGNTELSALWPPARVANLLRRGWTWPRDLSTTAVSTLIANGRIVRFPAAATIADQTDKDARWAIILAGLVRISTQTVSGQDFLVDLLEPGSHCGLLACLDQKVKVHGATAEAVTDALVVNAGTLRTLLQLDLTLNAVVIGLLCVRMRSTMLAMEQFAVWTPRTRLAARLCGLVRSVGRQHPDGIEIMAHLPQESLAAMIGLSRQRTNKILRDFERDGVLILDYSRIIVSDVARLRKSARPAAH